VIELTVASTGIAPVKIGEPAQNSTLTRSTGCRYAGSGQDGKDRAENGTVLVQNKVRLRLLCSFGSPSLGAELIPAMASEADDEATAWRPRLPGVRLLTAKVRWNFFAEADQ